MAEENQIQIHDPNTTIEITNLRFTYPGIDGQPPPRSAPLIDGFSLSLRSGHRCLLVSSNGAGKTTILKILGGKHMVEPSMVRVLGRSAFHETALTSSGDLCYLGREVLILYQVKDVAAHLEGSASVNVRLLNAPIGVEAIDDDVVISAPTRFAEARNHSKRNQVVTVVLDEDSNAHQN